MTEELSRPTLHRVIAILLIPALLAYVVHFIWTFDPAEDLVYLSVLQFGIVIAMGILGITMGLTGRTATGLWQLVDSHVRG